MGKDKNMKGPLKLLIVESPAKIKTISKFLGGDFKIMSTFGHVKDLPSNKLGVSIDAKSKHINLEYEVIEDKQSKIDDICKIAKKVDEVYLASDPDREGEIIAWHIGQEIEKVLKNKTHMYRITFNEITKKAIFQAIEHKSTIDIKKVEAQQARRILDRWVGYEVSPILWKKITKGLSAGRVQSAALFLICQRDEEIKAFKPEESWSIHGIFTFNDEQIQAELYKISNKVAKLENKEQADAALNEIKKLSYTITDIQEKKRFKNALPPFMTSTLQQDAFNKLGFSVDKTMMIAQKLYEGIPLEDKNSPEALITYMRTDSLRISDTAISEVRSFIQKEYGNEYLPQEALIYAKKGAQDAHEAIRPVSVFRTPQTVSKYASKDEAKLYELIWKRFMACQMTPAEYFQRTVLIDSGKYMFKATGSTLIFDGFLKVYLIEDDEEEQAVVKLPKGIAKGLSLLLKKLDSKQHFTQPPPRYTEATLVKELEKRGIGRPSTYAAILSTIQKRNYATRDKKRFSPTELGTVVNKMLLDNLPDIINVTFTAQMEENLDKIAHGERERDTVLHEFYEKFKKDLKEFSGGQEGKTPITSDVACPQCGKMLIIRFGKTGQFLGCPGFPECTFTSNFSRDETGAIQIMKAQTMTQNDLKCPNCGKNLVQKMGKFGPFLSCPGYPECKYIHQDALKTPCPVDGSKLIKRRWKGGSFWGCSGYPKCKFALFGEVLEQPCPQCKLPFILVVRDKQGNTSHTCSDKACGYKESA